MSVSWGRIGVVFVDEVGDTVGEVDAAGDLFAPVVFVFQRLDPAFDDAVGVRGAVAGAHVGEVCPGGEPARSGDGFHGGAVVGHDHERRGLAGRLVGTVLDERAPSSASAAPMAASKAARRSPAVWVAVTGHARATLAA